VDDPVEAADVGGQRAGQVVVAHRQVRRALERLQPLRPAAQPVVPHDDLDRRAVRVAAVPVQRRLHEVVAQEAAAAGHQQPAAAHAVELGGGVGAHAPQVLVEQRGQGDHRTVHRVLTG
jgi:hypothetical protein